MIPAPSLPTLRDILTKPGPFRYGVELVTTRGPAQAEDGHRLVEFGEALAADPRIAWLSITDNAGGHPALPADWLARVLAEKRTNVVVHLTCKDLNRNGLEAAAWRYASDGFENILALTGDYPVDGFQGRARPVFDLDSVSLIAMLEAMNHGVEVPGKGGQTRRLERTNFFIGCGVSPFKRHERELMPQYFKLARKVRCGAKWIIPQLGYDMRKFHELKLFLKWAGLPDLPIVGNTYVLNKTVAGLFHRNKIAGCVVSEQLMDLVTRYAGGPDKGKSFFLELAAKQLAVFKGLGFAAGYLAGTTKAEVLFQVIDMAERFGPNDWKDFAREIQFPQADEFYLFERDPDTGLGDGTKLNRKYLESLSHPEKTPNVTLGYRLTHMVHEKAFTPGQGQFDRLARFYKKLDTKPDSVMARALRAVERVSKSIGFGCKDCGDCSLPDCSYLCPRASCSKGSRNGPCGGSHDGRCELDDKECLWARAYERAKYYGQSQHMLDGSAVFADAALEGTSSWANTFLGRDHHASKLTVNGRDPAPPDKPAT